MTYSLIKKTPKLKNEGQIWCTDLFQRSEIMYLLILKLGNPLYPIFSRVTVLMLKYNLSQLSKERNKWVCSKKK